MIKVSIQVGGGEGGIVASVRARSIGRALSLVGALYPRREAQVVFPLEPTFFVKPGGPVAECVEPAAPAAMAGQER